ncbi:PrBiP [Colletotrichum orchidophilum]|uniref:PrBiP n=1 Tax=Colletotrichum orchidophilum TaxID=1209926 RepID=A0A1G4BPH8_9PEZI|nr:PrBiP [Colletotrichum orchidophilum]OHF03215.1 PrBiP [Colletotrichum orchidophilum]
MLSLGFPAAFAFEVNGWDDELESDFIAIVSGALEVSCVFRRCSTIMWSDNLGHHEQVDPSVSSALFDSSHMVCDATEPEYFLHRALRHQISQEDFNTHLPREGHILMESVLEILKELKKTAETWTLGPIEQAVVSVPLYFTKEGRKIITEAGGSIGLQVPRIMKLPTAAAVAYGIDKSDDDFHFVVYDLGRETFDVSVFELDVGVFESLASISDRHLGKEIGQLIQQKQLRGISVFDANEMKAFEQTLPLMDQVIKTANLSRDDIAKVVVVGGYTGASQVRSMVRSYFGSGSCVVFDYPGSFRWVPVTLDYDEVVTFGTAVFAENLYGQGRFDDLVGALMLNPRSVLVETIGGEALRVFPRFTSLPATRTVHLTTTVDGQSSIVITVFQGELADARKNDELLALRLDCIPPAPRGTHTIEVVLEAFLDAPNDMFRLLLKTAARLRDGIESCADSASGVLYEFGAVDALSDEEIELEAAYVYGRAEPGPPGTCITRRSEIDQHYVATAERLPQ